MVDMDLFVCVLQNVNSIKAGNQEINLPDIPHFEVRTQK